MALQDGFALIDPHGDLVARVAARIPGSCCAKVLPHWWRTRQRRGSGLKRDGTEGS
jgi:hypothetical protein